MSQKYADSKAFTPNAAQVEQRSFLELSYDIGMEDILRPDFWRPISGQISKHGIVTVIGGCDNVDADLRCVDSGNGYCIMRVIRQAAAPELSRDTHTAAEGRRVEYRPTHGWCAIDDDNTIIKSNLPNREAAFAHLDGKEAA